MSRIFSILIYIIIFSSCARKNFNQTDALYYSNEKADAAKVGYVWATAGRHYAKGTLHNLIWGKHHRQIWSAPVQVPVFNPENLYGGLFPVELGGGLQTTSLTLQNKSGQLYTLRTLDKDPAKSLSTFWRATFLANLMRDQTTAINPYGAFIVPPLAIAAGIPCTHPAVFYVPAKVPGLKEYSEAFAGKMVILEEKYKGIQGLDPYFNTAKDLIDTEELIQKHFKSQQHRMDQLAFARARLFDVLLLDWDRHGGQWNWAAYSRNAGGTLYKPVPKDRDYVFYQYDDGLIPWLLTRKFLAHRINILKHNVQDVEGLIYKGRFLDERFLNEVTSQDWQNIALEMQKALPDSLIRRAVLVLPDSVYRLTGEKTYELLKKRVAALPDLAQDYYKLLARRVTVAGTNKRERFVVKRLNNDFTQLEIFNLSDSPDEITERSYYRRQFSNAETKEIILHGLKGNDEFILEGQTNKGIQITIYGGAGTDIITNNSAVKGINKKTKIIDTRAGNKIAGNKDTRIKPLADGAATAYDDEEF